jgi:hypothetical protein
MAWKSWLKTPALPISGVAREIIKFNGFRADPRELFRLSIPRARRTNNP